MVDTKMLASVGPKPIVAGKQAVSSSSHPIVTDTMVQVMKDGGNAVDAAVAGTLVQAVVEPHLTNHAGSILFLTWNAADKKAYMLNGNSTLVSDMLPFRPIPKIGIRFADKYNPCAAIPGLMPALGAMYDRFCSMPWEYLCQPAVNAAEQGHPVNSFEYGVLTEELRFCTYFPCGREHFTPNGFLPEVGDIFQNDRQAETMRRLAKEGPEYFTHGDWAKHFVAEANRLGWPINLHHMSANPPRWQEPLEYEHSGHRIIQLYPPERTGVFTAFVLGVLSNFDLKSMGHFTQSAQALYLMAHTLRRAHYEMGLLNDPMAFEVPVEQWLSKEYQKLTAEILWRSRPKIDLTNHIRVTAGNIALAAAGYPSVDGKGDHIPAGSCELSIVDAQGNWVQMMNTLQGGGIPGFVVDGVPMVGSHARTLLTADIAGWFAGDARIRSIVGSTIVLKDGEPWLSLGTPGNVYGTIPQVLSNILDYGMDPYTAADQPRMDPLRDDYVLEVESRISPDVVAAIAGMGIRIQPLPMYDWNMGSFQMCWKTADGKMNSCADPRRSGKAGGY
jgi:gamma-glutamyltranspeptidase / glutathione hydrolase